MSFTLFSNGDQLEKQAADFVAMNIPNYEILWAAFIGNDGTNRMIKLEGLDEQLEKSRRSFSQHHYTILESLFFMHLIAVEESKNVTVTDFESYRQTLNRSMAFFGYMGRLRDNIEKCFAHFGEGKMWDNARIKLEPFFYARHIAIHGNKIPYSLDSFQLFQIPKLRTHKESDQGYDQNGSWETISSGELAYVSEEMEKWVSELCPIVNICIGEMYTVMKKKLPQIVEAGNGNGTDSIQHIGYSGYTSTEYSCSGSGSH